MQSTTLRRHHQAIIITLILLIHGTMLMMFISVQFQGMRPQEAVVMMQEDSNPMTEQDWIALNNSLPDSQIVAMDQSQEKREFQAEQPQVFEDPEDAQHIEEHATPQPEQKSELETQEMEIDDAIALASHLLDAQEQKEVEKQTEQPQEQTRPKTHLTSNPTENKPTLAELTQGFVQHLQTADMAVRSNRSGTAGIEQIKHVNYCQKIIGCIVNSYKINSHLAPAQKMLARRARIQLALNRNGTIAQLQLQESSGDPTTDRFLIDMFQDAATSFPPVPEALNASPYQLPTFAIESLESFRHAQGWYIDAQT